MEFAVILALMLLAACTALKPVWQAVTSESWGLRRSDHTSEAMLGTRAAIAVIQAPSS